MCIFYSQHYMTFPIQVVQQWPPDSPWPPRPSYGCFGRLGIQKVLSWHLVITSYFLVGPSGSQARVMHLLPSCQNLKCSNILDVVSVSVGTVVMFIHHKIPYESRWWHLRIKGLAINVKESCLKKELLMIFGLGSLIRFILYSQNRKFMSSLLTRR